MPHLAQNVYVARGLHGFVFLFLLCRVLQPFEAMLDVRIVEDTTGLLEHTMQPSQM